LIPPQSGKFAPEEDQMGRKHHQPEEIVAKLRQVEFPTGLGRSIAEAVRSIEGSEQTYFRRRAEYGGMKIYQLQRLKESELEKARLIRAVSDLTLDKRILKALDEPWPKAA
jgi:hypothetical protein